MSMRLYDDQYYMKGIRELAESDLSWDKLSKKKILIAGATGLIGRYLIDAIMYRNQKYEMGCYITALSRNADRARSSFDGSYNDSELFEYTSGDVVNLDVEQLSNKHYNYVFHLASNTHPVSYSTKPIETIISNVYGTKNLLDICAQCNGSRFVLLSSVEIYGEKRSDTELFDEKYLGYLDSNTLRAGYPESKRVSESLVQAYIKEKDLDAVIVRLPRVFGPTLRPEDSKAVSQFIHKAVEGEDIVLKSEGKQFYSFLFVKDAVSGLLKIALDGACGEAYNVADETCDKTLREMADLAAGFGGVKVIFELPDQIEKSGFSTATVARLDGRKLRSLGWKQNCSVENGLRDTISILKRLR